MISEMASLRIKCSIGRRKGRMRSKLMVSLGQLFKVSAVGVEVVGLEIAIRGGRGLRPS